MGRRIRYSSPYRQTVSATLDDNKTYTGGDTENDDKIFHIPVLLKEVLDGLRVQKGKKYIDATLGGGGHTFEILKRGGKVLGTDIDEEAIEYVKLEVRSKKLKVRIGKDLVLVRGNFRDIGEIARRQGFEKVSGILFDLGVSLHQLTTAERGFSFLRDGPLDMRMDPSTHSTSSGQAGSGLPSATAADLVNGLYKHELTNLFQRYGEEQLARKLAHAICRARKVKRITTTGELARIVETVKKSYGRMHPATQVFQAIRIAVNDELGSLEEALPQAIDLLEMGGWIGVISFHSLEDRIVKNFFKEQGEYNMVTKKPIIADKKEMRENPRARSAKLRIYGKEKLYEKN